MHLNSQFGIPVGIVSPNSPSIKHSPGNDVRMASTDQMAGVP